MSSGLDWERFGVITGGDDVCILPPPILSEKGVGIPTFVYFPKFFRSYNEVFVQRAFIPYYLRTDIDFVCVLCTSSSAAAVAYLSLFLSLCIFVQGYLTQYRHFCTTYPFIFSQLQRSVCTNSIYCLLPFWQVLFFDVTTGLILCTPLYATN